MRLRTKLLLPFAILALLLSATFWYLSHWLLESGRQQLLAREQYAIALLHDDLARFVEQRNLIAINRVLDNWVELNRQQDAYQVQVQDVDGVNLYPETFDSQLLSPYMLYAHRPLLVGDVVVGSVHVSWDWRKQYQQRLQSIYVLALVMLLFVALAGAVALVGYARLVSRPLQAFTDAAKHLAQGRYSISLPAYEQGELDQFTHSFEQMRKRFLHTQMELQEKAIEAGNSGIRLRTVLEAIPCSLITVSTGGHIEDMNWAAEEMFGYPLFEAVELDINQLFVAGKNKGFWQQILSDLDDLPMEALRQGLEYQCLHKDGRSFPILLFCSDMHVANQRCKLVIALDISEQKAIERRLAQSSEIYQDLYESIPLAYFSIDVEGRVIHCNDRAVTLFGYQKEQLSHKTMVDLFVDRSDSVGGRQQVDSRVLRGEAISGVEMRLRRADGRVIWGSVAIQPEFDGISKRVMVEDITHRKRSETDLLIAKQEAEQANDAKSEFLSRMSHELRTPMNAILGFAQMLSLDEGRLSAIQRDSVKEILVAGQHLLKLINEVLDLARIEAGSVDYTIEDVALDTLIPECVALIRPLARNRSLEIVDQISNKGYAVRADSYRLKQILLNLISNAVKYNRSHGYIKLFVQPRVEGLRICILDSGEGMSAQSIDKLFTPFQRLDADKEIEGSGVGLFISKQLTELMGGNIGVTSALGEGSTFWVEFVQTQKVTS